MPAGTIEVTGPHKISMNGTEVGRGDNDDLFRLETEYMYTDLHTNEYGTMPAESVLVGAKASVSFSLVYFDRANFMSAVDLGAGRGGTQQWVFPAVGTKTGAGDTADTTFSIVLTPDSVASGQKTITVYRCRLISVSYADFGNKANRAIIRCEALPDVDNAQTDSAIYAIT